MRVLPILFAAILIMMLAVLASLLTAVEPEEHYTAISLAGQTAQDKVSFTIENNEAYGRMYTYEIYETEHTGEKKACSGTVYVRKGQSALTSVPVKSKRAERIRVVLVDTGQEVSYYTNYTYQEWRPVIEQGIPWDRQDPLVQHYYRYVQEPSKEYDHSR
jgi:hypothetical protein